MKNYDQNQAHYISVTGILVKDGKYLIVKRAEWEKAFPGMWTVPGGKMKVLDYVLRKKDTKEHWYNVLEDVLKREVKEETNLEISNTGYITSMVYIRPDNIPCLIVSLWAEVKEGEVRLCPALSEYSWATLGDAKTFDLIEGIYNEIEIIDSYLKKGETKIWINRQKE